MDRMRDLDYARTHDITVEEVKACPCFQHFTEEQAREVIEALKTFAKIAYDLYQKNAFSHGNSPENT